MVEATIVDDVIRCEVSGAARPPERFTPTATDRPAQGLAVADCPLCGSSVCKHPLTVSGKGILRRALKTGETLYGGYGGADRGRAVATIRSGLVKLVEHTAEGVDRIVRLARAGEVIGLEALLAEPYRHHAIALQPTSVCLIPVQLLSEQAAELPDGCLRLMRLWQRLLDASDHGLLAFTGGCASRRIGLLIVYLMQNDEEGCKEPRPFFLPKRDDIAALVGVTSESVCRIVASLQKVGALRRIGADWYTCDLEKMWRALDLLPPTTQPDLPTPRRSCSGAPATTASQPHWRIPG
jgi:CRP-like cAMP-binding protein